VYSVCSVYSWCKYMCYYIPHTVTYMDTAQKWYTGTFACTTVFAVYSRCMCYNRDIPGPHFLCITSTFASANSFAGIHFVGVFSVCMYVCTCKLPHSLVRHHADTSERNSREYNHLHVAKLSMNVVHARCYAMHFVHI